MLDMIQTALIYVVPFLFVLTLVVTIHELGHFWVARALGVEVDRFAIGFGRPIASWTDKSGVNWRIGWIPLGGYVRFAGDTEASSSVPDADALAHRRAEIASTEGPGAEQKYFHFKPVWARALVVAAGPFANFILAILLFAALLMTVGNTVVTPRVGYIEPGGPAARAGFAPGDLITAVDGKTIDNFFDVQRHVMLRPNQPIRFTVERDNAVVDLTATPQRRDGTDNLTGADTRFGVIGLGTAATEGAIYRKRYAPAEALVGGVSQTYTVLTTTVYYLGRIVRGLESGDQLGGPLRIAAVSGGAAKAGAEGAPDATGKALGGLVALLSLAAYLSVGIGFMNLLPVPVLDGGHLVFYAYEALARRPLGARIQAGAYRVGLALLLCLMLFATWNDLQQLRVFKLLGGLFS